MQPNDIQAVKDLQGAAQRGSPRKLAASSDGLTSKTNILPFRRANGGDDPQPPDPSGNHGPRLLSSSVLDCVAVDMARRWCDHETSIVTIRRKLNVSIPEAERIVRKGMKLRQRQAA